MPTLLKYAVGYSTSVATLGGLIASWKISAVCLSPIDLETFALCRRLLSTILPFIECGIPLAVTQFVAVEHYEKSGRDEKAILAASIAWCIGLGGFLLSLCYFSGDTVRSLAGLPDDFQQYMPWVCFWALGNSMFAVASGWWYAKQRFLLANAAKLLLFIIPLPILMLTNVTIYNKLMLITVFALASFSTALWQISRKCNSHFSLPMMFEKGREQIKFGLPRTFGKFTLVIMLWIPVMHVSKYQQEYAIGVAFGLSVTAMMVGLMTPIGTLLHSTMIVKLHRRQFTETAKLVSLTFACVTALSILGTIFLWYSMPAIITGILSEKYLDQIYILRLLTLVQIPLAVCSVMQHILDIVDNKPKNVRNGVITLISFIFLASLTNEISMVVYALTACLFLRAFITIYDLVITLRLHSLIPPYGQS